MDPGKCDTCGATATRLAQDMTEIVRADEKLAAEGAIPWGVCEPRGTVKRGCEEHMVASNTYDEGGKLIRYGIAVRMTTEMPDWKSHLERER